MVRLVQRSRILPRLIAERRAELARLSGKFPPGVSEIRQIVAAHYGLIPEQLDCPSRQEKLVCARHIAQRLCHELAHISLDEIGLIFGGRHHTTILHAARAVSIRVEVDPQFAREYEAIVVEVKSQVPPLSQ